MQELTLPELGENIDSVVVTSVLVKPGDLIRSDQPIVEVETEKASLEVPALSAGRVVEILVLAGTTVSVGQVLLRIEPLDASETSPAVESGPTAIAAPATLAVAAEVPVIDFPVAAAQAPVPTERTVPASPSTRALAREIGVDVRQVAGSGPGGRISRDDVKAHAKARIAGAAGPTTGEAAPRPLPDFARWGEVERQPLTNVRRATARNMAAAWSTVPHVTQFDNADITQLESMRRRFNQRPEAEKRKLTVTAIVVKMIASALRQFPRFNASLDLERGETVLKKYLHVGVAVDTERGLLVPVIRDVDGKSVLQVASELREMAGRARQRKLLPDEMQGASFTVSNLGGLGTTYFSPIVNWPEVAILGVGRAEQRAVLDDGSFVPRRILPLSLSYDHRLIDGADAARFLRWLAEALEQPLLLLLDE